jgi:hypothetical protein
MLHFALAFAVMVADVQATTERQTFLVESVLDDASGANIGSAVVVASNDNVLTLVTAAHVLLPKSTTRILDRSRAAFYTVLETRVLPDYDLAFLRVRAQRNFPVTPPRFGVASAGEAVYLWGNPGDSYWAMADGAVDRTAASLPGERGDPRITILCAKCDHGDSGSGVFDAQGALLGILTAGWKDRLGNVAFLEVQPASLIFDEVRPNVLGWLRHDGP